MNEVESYKFNEFKSGHVIETSKDDNESGVTEFQLMNMKETLGLKAASDEDISRERDFANQKNFQISPIVKEHRGIIEQEYKEKEFRIEQEVQKRVNKVKEEAYRDGYDKGLEAGREEVFNQTRSMTEEKIVGLTEMINEVLSVKVELIETQRTEIYEMIRTLTKWIILKELDKDDDYLNRLFEKLLIEIQTKSNLLIKVSSKQFDQMDDVLEHVQRILGKLTNIRLEIDYDILDQGIVVESDNGIINGTLSQQLDSLDKIFESTGILPSDNDVHNYEAKIEDKLDVEDGSITDNIESSPEEVVAAKEDTPEEIIKAKEDSSAENQELETKSELDTDEITSEDEEDKDPNEET